MTLLPIVVRDVLSRVLSFTTPATPTGKKSQLSVEQACEKHFETNKTACNFFVQAVAREFGIDNTVCGTANDIVGRFRTGPWVKVTDGIQANERAKQGWFVVGGLVAEGPGHVVVVVPGPLNRGKYPTAYWGSIIGKAKKKTTINWSWNEDDRDRVIYAAINIGARVTGK